MGWKHCFINKCSDHRWAIVDAGYYPSQVGQKGKLSKVDKKELKKRKTVRIRLRGEEGEQTMTDVEALERQISNFRSQLDCATQIIMAKDNDLKRLHNDKEKLKQTLNRVSQRRWQVGATLWREGV